MATGAIDKEFIIDITGISEPAKWHPECCIYTVPRRFRKINEEAYTPKLISVGPIHHYYKDELKFKEMEMLKLKYFKEFFARRVQKDFANIVVKNENKIRCCYEAGISLPEKEELVKMILLDSIFIIQLFLRTDARDKDKKNYELSTETDYILSKPWLDDDIRQDLILLENQLPFFILDELYYYFARSTTDVPESFLKLACNYFFPCNKITIDQRDVKVKHFTDLHRSFYCPPHLETGDRTIEHLYSATKLNEAGLKFQKWEEKKLEEKEEEEHKFLLDMKIEKPYQRVKCSWLVQCLRLVFMYCLPCLKHFSCVERLRTCLVIPRFVVDCKTEGLFRNLMALEQCHYPSHAYICNYILLLDFLINTSEDVELLVDEGIIVNWLGSNEAVATMVNKLGQEIVEKNSCYHKIATKLNGHYDNCWNHNMASLKTVYFRDIWRGTATVVGIIVLFVTVGNFLRPFLMKK